jgi:hypothetical protein
MQCLSPVEVGVRATGKGVNSLYLSTTQSMISGNLCYLLTNKTISRVPDSKRYSNKETIQNKNKTKTHN